MPLPPEGKEPVRTDGLEPEQMVCAEPEELFPMAGRTETKRLFEVAGEQTPEATIRRK